MFSFEKLADNIAERLALSLKMDDEKRSVMAYGIFGFLQILLSVFMVVLFGLLFHVLAEALIISFSIAILRKYSGGAHADTPAKCLIIGTVISVFPAFVIANTPINFMMALLFTLTAFFWSYIQIAFKAPVDSVKKPITNPQKRKRLKKGSLVILSGYLLIAAICLYGYFPFGEKSFLRYAVCLSFGALWQSFTLTKLGHHLLIFIDDHLKIN